MTAIVLDAFDFLENDRGDLLLALDAQEGEPETPLLYYNGTTEGVLRRGGNVDVVLHEIPESISEALKAAGTLLVSEVDTEGDPIHVYEAPVEVTANLPSVE